MPLGRNVLRTLAHAMAAVQDASAVTTTANDRRTRRSQGETSQRPSDARCSHCTRVRPRLCACVGRGDRRCNLRRDARTPASAPPSSSTTPKINHYFVTAYPEEAAALDAGTNVKGWTRTGGQFTVFTEPADGLQAVCRFFGTPDVGPELALLHRRRRRVREGEDAAGVDVRGHRVLHPDAEQRRLRRQLAGVPQLLLGPDRGCQSPLHGRPDRARADERSGAATSSKAS